jgi:hypothetical protein
LPELQDTRALTLNIDGVRRIWLEGDLVLAAGMHGATAFDVKSGERRWEKGRLDEWIPLGDSMLATDSTDHGKRARLIAIGLRDGTARELYAEAAPKR